MITMNELHWLAGYIEGEGCFHLRSGRKGTKSKAYPGIAITTTDKDVADRAKALLGRGTSRTIKDLRKESYKLQHRIDVSSPRCAAAWMMTLYPLLGERRRQRIREVLSVWKSYKPRNTRAKHWKWKYGE